jgi:hypothetical protein
MNNKQLILANKQINMYHIEIFSLHMKQVNYEQGAIESMIAKE